MTLTSYYGHSKDTQVESAITDSSLVAIITSKQLRFRGR